MAQNIKLSISCLTYNHENYIRKTLDGFLMQKTSFDFEVLIHDDASTDGTADIIREYEAKYPNIIKPIYQKENQHSQGVRISNVFQYPRAQGEYIAWCEGDDFWTDENKLQAQVDFLDNNPQYIGCVHKYITVNKEGEETNLKTFGYYENEGVYTLKDFETNELPSQLATYVVRNIFCKEGKSYPSSFQAIKMQGDIKMNLYLLIYGDIYRLPNVSSAYRFVSEAGGSSWSSRMLKNYNASYNCWKALKLLEKATFDEYNVKISLKKRKIEASISVVKIALKKPNAKTIGHALHVLFMQRGILITIFKMAFRRKNKSRREKV